MKRYLPFFALTCLMLTHPASAGTNQINFKPYHDLTLNTRWDSQYQDMEPMDLALSSQESGVKDYRLAFITDAGNCTPAWGGQTSFGVQTAWGSHLLQKLQGAGIQYDIALGGANGNDISLACSLPQLQSVYDQIIKIYKPRGLDFDIENGTADVLKIMNALQQIKYSHPEVKISFTLPVMPEGLTASGEEIVRQAQKANLDFSVNIMAMDYGPAYPNGMGDYAVLAANNLFNFLKSIYASKNDEQIWNMVEVTPMIGVNDVSVEQFTLGDVDILRGFAKQKHLAALSMWSVARDNPCADQWASPTCSGRNLQTQPYEFEKRFLD